MRPGLEACRARAHQLHHAPQPCVVSVAGEAEQLAAVIATGALPKVTYIDLRGNAFAHEGWNAIADAIFSLRADGTAVSPLIGSILMDPVQETSSAREREAVARLDASHLAQRRQVIFYRGRMRSGIQLDKTYVDWARSLEAEWGWPPVEGEAEVRAVHGVL